MKKKLKVQSLIKKYPKIFRQSKLPMTQTCMCWGIETDEGWYDLLDSLCSQLQWDIDRNRYPQIEAVQVKEKFGTLRFYTSGKEGDFDRLVKSGEISQKEWDRRCGTQDGMISFAEFLSGSICEKCGSNQDVKQTEGWIYTRCPECMRKLRA